MFGHPVLLAQPDQKVDPPQRVDRLTTAQPSELHIHLSEETSNALRAAMSIASQLNDQVPSVYIMCIS